MKCDFAFMDEQKFSKVTAIKTHNSELRGQEEAGCMRQTSELFTGSTALKFLML